MKESRTKTSRLRAEILELADDMKRAGLIDGAAHGKITMRHVEPEQIAIAPITAQDVKAMRAQARMSQAVFARHLNLTVGYISQLERGEKRPAGAALALLDVIRRKGLAAIL